jgi:hypothetical protein
MTDADSYTTPVKLDANRPRRVAGGDIWQAQKNRERGAGLRATIGRFHHHHAAVVETHAQPTTKEDDASTSIILHHLPFAREITPAVI